MAALLERDELDEGILSIAENLADQFIAALEEDYEADMRLALAGLQLTFLSQVAKLVTQ
jgi:hypothetical protein